MDQIDENMFKNMNQSQMYQSMLIVTLKIVTATLGNVYFGYALAYYGITQDSIIVILGYQDSQLKTVIDGLINSVLPLGAALGAFYSGKIVTKFGFRTTFIISDIIGILNCILSMYLNYATLIVTRLVYGIFVGINSALDPQYVHQISPSNYTGLFGTLCNVGLLAGLTIAFILEWVFLQVSPKEYDSTRDYGYGGFNSWRYLMAFPALTCFIRLMAFTLCFRKDLPSEYLARDNRDEARDAIIETHKSEFVCQMMDQVVSEQMVHGKNVSVSDLFTPLYKRRFITGCVLSLLCQFCGINVVNFYSVTIFDSIADGNFSIINILTIADGVISMIVCLIGGIIINKFGRRIVFLVGNGVCAISLTSLSILYYYLKRYDGTLSDEQFNLVQRLLVAFVFTFLIAYSMSLGPVFWLYIAEILPPSGISIVVLINWIALAFLSLTFPILAEKTSVYVCFGVFAIFTILGQLFIFKEVKETKRLSKIQINTLFDQPRNKLKNAMNASERSTISDAFTHSEIVVSKLLNK